MRLPKDSSNAKTSHHPTFGEGDIYPSKSAIDGVYISSLSLKICQSTNWAASNETAWWQIEYKNTVLVHSVELYNRVDDCCGERLSNTTVFVFKNGVDGTRQYCGKTDGNTATKRYIKIICPEPLEGNLIRVESPLGKMITLCEVDIYGAFSIQV